MFRKLIHSLLRDKLYTLINVLGLAVAMTSCIVLGLFLYNEFTYDRHHQQHENIYRIESEFIADGRRERIATSSQSLGLMMAAEYPVIEDFVRIRSPDYWWELGTDRLIRHGDNAFFWEDVFFADANVFDVFTHEVIYGNPATALMDPSSAAVSETFATRYFGDADPVGETIILDNGERKTITLVFADFPANTHLTYDVLFSYNSIPPPENETERINGLFGAGDYTYLVMPDDFDIDRFETMARSFFDRHMAGRADEINIEGWNAWLQPLRDIHLYSGGKGTTTLHCYK